jgi:hypothetical protein
MGKNLINQLDRGGEKWIASYILSASEGEYLNGKSRHKIGREADQMDLSTLGHTLHRPVITSNDNDNKISCYAKHVIIRRFQIHKGSPTENKAI